MEPAGGGSASGGSASGGSASGGSASGGGGAAVATVATPVQTSRIAIPVGVAIALFICAVFTIGVGLAPAPLIDLARRATLLF
jgi:hypothetical protein